MLACVYKALWSCNFSDVLIAVAKIGKHPRVHQTDTGQEDVRDTGAMDSSVVGNQVCSRPLNADIDILTRDIF